VTDYVDVPLRVRYADTDRMGIVYYGTYAAYFEVGRSEYMRAKGFSYRAFEEMGYFLVVSAIEMKYHNSAQYDDLVHIRTSVSDVRSRGLTFAYTIHKDGKTMVEGMTKHICLNAKRKPVRIPSFLLDVLTHARGS
jgi:acyl-CoA thioester hydrolase